ncbi:MAG: hypothetical protein ACLRSW_16700 [Christensenellaceae bacterium]
MRRRIPQVFSLPGHRGGTRRISRGEKGGRIFILATRATVESQISKALSPRHGKISAGRAAPMHATDWRRWRSTFPARVTISLPFPEKEARCRGARVYALYILKGKGGNIYGCPVYDGNEGFPPPADILALETEKLTPWHWKRKIDSLWPPVTTDSDFLCADTFAPFCPLKRAVSRERKKIKSEHLFARLLKNRENCPEKGVFLAFFPRSGKSPIKGVRTNVRCGK